MLQHAYGLNPSQWLPPERIDVSGSAFWVIALGVVALGGLLMMALVRMGISRERARVEGAASEANAPLVPGYAVLHGAVEADGSHAPFISVVIHQAGTEACNKGQWSHRWAEISRDVTARAFDLVLESGTRVRVEPDPRVFVVDGLDKTQRDPQLRRRRIAELNGGDRVWVVGDLDPGSSAGMHGHAYRSGGTGAVLRPPRRGGRMLVSTEPLHLRHAQRARVFSLWVAIAAGAFLLVNLGLFQKYYAMTIVGRTAMVDGLSTNTYQTWHKPKNSRGYWVTHYRMAGSYVGTDHVVHSVRDDCSYSLYTAINSADVSRVPFRIVPGTGMHQLGAQPTLERWRVVLAFLIAAALHVGYWIATYVTLPWYDRKRVVDRGPGRL